MQSLENLLEQDPSWNLEELVLEANARLGQYLPDDPGNLRVREEVTPRLVRHYTTLRMLDEPAKEGREARYRARHLLQLLVVRRLMSEGYGASALGELARQKSNPELLGLLQGGATLTLTPGNPALSYLSELRKEYRVPSAAIPPPASAPKQSEAPAPAPPMAAQRWYRQEIVPGFELHISEDFRYPKSPSETDTLLQRIRHHLEALKQRKR